MKKAAILLFLLTAIGARAQQSGMSYAVKVNSVNTEHGVKISATAYYMYDGNRAYDIKTRCTSFAGNPCIVPEMGMNHPKFVELGGRTYLYFGNQKQTPAEIIDIRESK